MIRQLSNNDKKQCLDFLYQEAEYNIFPIGDIETFGFEVDFQQVYGEFDEGMNLQSILLFYKNNAIFYAKTVSLNPEYLVIIKGRDFRYLSGKTAVLEMVQPYIPNFKRRTMYFCKADSIKTSIEVNQILVKELKTREDARKLHRLLVGIDDFNIDLDVEAFIDHKMSSIKMGVTLFVEINGQIISSVASTAETTKSAMVVAVATDQAYRRQGYASMLMMQLMKIYIEDKKKSLCLFYDNPRAGEIYLRLGFEYIGLWDMYSKK